MFLGIDICLLTFRSTMKVAVDVYSGQAAIQDAPGCRSGGARAGGDRAENNRRKDDLRPVATGNRSINPFFRGISCYD
jgi:hypothetical protein